MRTAGKYRRRVAIELSYCVVNTDQRKLLVRCLDAIADEQSAVDFPTEVIVLDNASRDGSAGAARNHPATTTLVVLDRRRGKADNDSNLLQRARGRYCLLLNEDSELLPGATVALRAALDERPDAAAAGARLLRPDGRVQPSAWRFPTPLTALVGALFLHRLYTVESRGSRTRTVDWAQSAAPLGRRDAAPGLGRVGPPFFPFSGRGGL